MASKMYIFKLLNPESFDTISTTPSVVNKLNYYHYFLLAWQHCLIPLVCYLASSLNIAQRHCEDISVFSICICKYLVIGSTDGNGAYGKSTSDRMHIYSWCMTAEKKRLEFVQCIYCNLIVTAHRVWNTTYPVKGWGDWLSELNKQWHEEEENKPLNITIWESQTLSLSPQHSSDQPLSILFLYSPRNMPRQIYTPRKGHNKVYRATRGVTNSSWWFTNHLEVMQSVITKQRSGCAPFLTFNGYIRVFTLSLTIVLVKGLARVKRKVISHQLLCMEVYIMFPGCTALEVMPWGERRRWSSLLKRMLQSLARL